ncbi:glycosyltransferase 87 family protein [Micromonospora sp. 4G57]|uniref:Glycosyltransferase 87 family protein n=1 Tax=Micromonospora sicca TaxID=2202420 RepID=A0ABU5JAK0_9ACTN|nr:MULTISPECIES: glycosyltransferase 87 family protein [unclassified Micromonospora]MDZ5444162.1 glycosyltransferase 87 family protein [Micromonospora sp. 4G57]MDZ5489484.1 glycosyltransferase 87 family protein [Micromonospora sp. 4G53]
MSTQSTAGIDDAGTTDHPSRSDGFVRGASEVIGGPLGDHAVALDRPAGREGRFWTAARIVLALVCLTLALHWVQKSPCQDGAWQNNIQYTRMCYTDVLALYYAEGLNEGKVPYADHPVEYPVLTGYFMGALGLPVHALGADHPGINQGQWFYNLNALVLSALAVATVAVILNLRRRRPWDAAMFALAPALLLTATVNWDLLAVGLSAVGLLAWARARPDLSGALPAALAGVLIGLGGAAKMWPLFILGPILVLAVRAGRVWAALLSVITAAVTVVLVNLPVAIPYRESWGRFFELNTTRPIDWGTLWYIGRYLDGKVSPDQGPFDWLNANIPTLNWVSYLLFGLACLGVAALALLAPRRPRLAQLAFLVVAAFLIFSKVWSQQFVLWLLPLAVLARPRWGAFLVWQFAEVCYFAAFYGELLGTATSRPVFPEGVFVLAASLRLITVAVLCGFVIRDVMRPERDVVRHIYADDPDGGVLDGSPDAPWYVRWRARSSTGSAAAEPAPA